MLTVWLLNAVETRRHSMDDFVGMDWQDWMIIGPLSEQIAEEMREQDSIQRDNDDCDDDYGKLSIDDDEL
jgi:hypothetical protein